MTEFQQTLALAGTGVFIIAGLLAFAQHYLHLFFDHPPAPAQVFVRWLSEEHK
jgi:O-antigen/teichoic acid export membrane protein